MWDASKIRIICEKVQLQVFYSVYMKKLVKQLTNIDQKTELHIVFFVKIFNKTAVNMLLSDTCILINYWHRMT